jgi:hypothetical protein
MHHVPFDSFPSTPYPTYASRAIEQWPRLAGAYGLPYYPNVSVGWDSSPRTAQDGPFDPAPGYPFTSVLVDNGPAAFEHALAHARDFLDRQPVAQRILTVNSWNEWTEGSYLEPDTTYGMGYLEAIERVFRFAPARRIGKGTDVEDHLAHLLVGEDPANTEWLGE